MMRIAIFHNFMDNIGGAEMVSLTLARELNADIYTTNIDPEKIRRMGFESVLPRIHSIGRIPLRAPFRHQMSFWKFRHLNLKDAYDFHIISGDWAMSAAVNHAPNLWYVHSPLNELWQFKDYIRQTILSSWQRPLFDIWVWFNRKLSLRYFQHVGAVACNSKNTAGRMLRFYGKEATVIHPPIPVQDFKWGPHNNYWLSVNRLFANKRVDIQLKAFNMLPGERLIIVGSYEQGAAHFEEYKNMMEAAKPSNVEFIHWAEKPELIDLYAKCKGFITTSLDEDFGMTAVEAMAAGKPVIAPDEGGYKETVLDGKTGMLIPNISPDSLKDAVISMNQKLSADPEAFRLACREQAEKFDQKIFIGKIKELI